MQSNSRSSAVSIIIIGVLKDHRGTTTQIFAHIKQPWTCPGASSILDVSARNQVTHAGVAQRAAEAVMHSRCFSGSTVRLPFRITQIGRYAANTKFNRYVSGSEASCCICHRSPRTNFATC